MAVKLFEMKRLTSGQAALLAGVDRTTFTDALERKWGCRMIDMPAEELADDVPMPSVRNDVVVNTGPVRLLSLRRDT